MGALLTSGGDEVEAVEEICHWKMEVVYRRTPTHRTKLMLMPRRNDLMPKTVICLQYNRATKITSRMNMRI